MHKVCKIVCYNNCINQSKGDLNMETTTISSKIKNTMLVSTVLSVIGIGFSIFNLFVLVPQGETVPVILNAVNLLLLALTLNYLFVGYKKPHGNLLRAAFFMFALSIIIKDELVFLGSEDVNIAANMASSVSALMIAYAAGRLDKLEKNTTVLMAAGLFMLAHFLLLMMADDFILGRTVASCTNMIVLAGLGAAYTARYEAHKAAGKKQ